MKVDFNKLKTDISLPDLFMHYGWNYAPGTSNAAVKLTNGSQTVVIKKNSKGMYTYWDVHGEEHGKTCLDFMQQQIYDQTGKMPSLREVGEALQRFLDNHEIISAENSNIKVTNASLDSFQLSTLRHELHPYKGNFLSMRGITSETLSSPVFKGVFYSREYKHYGKKYNNTCVELINQNGFQGVSQRGFDEEGKSFKGIKGYKYGSIAVSKHDTSRPLDLVLIGESMIDNASHFQLKYLNTEKNILYVSTEGNITLGQIELISQLITHNKRTNISDQVNYIFDNDHNGYKYAIKLDTYLKEQTLPEIEDLTTEELKNRIDQLPNVDLPRLNDWNDELKASLILTKDKEFTDAVLKNDFKKIIEIQSEGYIPSTYILNDLYSQASTKMMAVIVNIFKLDISPTSSIISTPNIGASEVPILSEKINNEVLEDSPGISQNLNV